MYILEILLLSFQSVLSVISITYHCSCYFKSFPSTLQRRRTRGRLNSKRIVATGSSSLKACIPFTKTTRIWLKTSQSTMRLVKSIGQLLQRSCFQFVDLDTFVSDMQLLCGMIADGPLKSFCFQRLEFLQSKYKLHILLNEIRELAEQKAVPHRDFYNVRKVLTKHSSQSA